MIGICRLCGAQAELQESHHFPRFVIQWIKETGSGYFRRAVEPNKREQDGPKAHWLCKPCEQRFSAREKYFSEVIFHPYLNTGEASFTYDVRLFYFAISILWRTLVRNLDHSNIPEHRFYQLLSDAETKWRRYLLGESQDPGYSSVQLFLSDVTTNPTIPAKNFNLYLTRALDATVGSSKTECFIYSKFARFLFFGYLTPCPQEKWKNTQIFLDGGTLSVPQEVLDGKSGDFLVSRARESMELFDKGLNEKSKEAISRNFLKHQEKIVASDQWKAQAQDFMIPVVSHDQVPSIPKVGRNAPCPCGSNFKYKRCHGA